MTPTSRDIVLGRIRAAIAGDSVATVPAAAVIPRDYIRRGALAPGGEEVLELLVDRLVDYKAIVSRASVTDLGAAVREALAGTGSVVVPPGLDEDLVIACQQDGRQVATDGRPRPLTAAELDGIDAVVTRARVAIALSGTIILDAAPDQGRRAITLVPDLHVIILNADQVVETVPEAIALLDPTAPLTMIAGPSATSDIELQRVEGVHGPRTLHVIVVG